MKKLFLFFIVICSFANTCFAKVLGINVKYKYLSCDSVIVSFSSIEDSGFSGATYYWELGNGKSYITNDNYIDNVKYTKLGSYTVTLAYKYNQDSFFFSKPNLIKISKPPVPDFSFFSDDTGKYLYPPTKVNFINKTIKGGSDSLKYIWNIDTVSYQGRFEIKTHEFSNDSCPIYNFEKPGMYYIQLSVRDSNKCSVSKGNFVYIQPQPVDYIPFPTKNTIWTEMNRGEFPEYKYTFQIFALKDNDTLINGMQYHKLYRSTDTIYTENEVCGGIREEDKKIFYYSIDSIPLDYTGIKKNTEVLLFDFNLHLGDTIFDNSFRMTYGEPPYTRCVVLGLDIVTINNKTRRIFTLSLQEAGDLFPTFIPWAQWIEGIGYLRGLLFESGYLPGNGIWNDLICFREDNTLFNLNSSYDYCYYKTNNIEENEKKPGLINVYPNPSSVDIIVEFYNNGFEKLFIYNILGRQIETYNVSGLKKLEINRRDFKPGIYFIKAVGKNNCVATDKVIFN